MGMTNKVRLNICGSEYTFTTDEPEGYIQELARSWTPKCAI